MYSSAVLAIPTAESPVASTISSCNVNEQLEAGTRHVIRLCRGSTARALKELIAGRSHTGSPCCADAVAGTSISKAVAITPTHVMAFHVRATRNLRTAAPSIKTPRITVAARNWSPAARPVGVRLQPAGTVVWAKAGAAGASTQARAALARATRRGRRGAGRDSVRGRRVRCVAGRWAPIRASASRAPAVTLLLESSLTLALPAYRSGPDARSGCTPPFYETDVWQERTGQAG